MSEQESILIARLKEDDKEAFREIFDRYKARVYSFAARYLDNHSEIEEILQEVFVKLWYSRQRIREDLLLCNYLFTITKNTILHKKQKELNRQKYLNYLRVYYSVQTLGTEDEIQHSELQTLLDTAIDKLPPKRKEIYLLKKNDGLTYKEIASKLNLSVKTVESHMRLCFKNLRDALADYL